ncbi:heparinase II/III family protein [Qipengyuania sediminis]|uniref:heparinase II/III family protein n=1 Tax=Qipengyuania sediminis TaxID=1532023 RepID=UPI0010592B23|nr:heparinase II/III family protein [Qipengyuania sediminis]
MKHDPLLLDPAASEAEVSQPALPLPRVTREPAVGPAATGPADEEPIETARALVPADFGNGSNLADKALGWAYRLGVPGALLAAPLRKPARLRLLATVRSPLEGDSARGKAIRAGHFVVEGYKLPLAEADFSSSARLPMPQQKLLHGFTWLRDLAAAAPRETAAPIAEGIARRWLDAHGDPGKGPGWSVERAGQRLLAWLIHAPLVLSGEDAAMRPRMLRAIAQTARWLDRHVAKEPDRLGAATGWAAITAAGLLLPDGRPRRVYGEAGLHRALGEIAGPDGGVLSRSPLAQMQAIALLIDLEACYAAAGRAAPPMLRGLMEQMVPPLLALRHGDGGLGSWQGAGAVNAHALARLVGSSGIRARPARDARGWGYRVVQAGKAVLQFDAAPPPRPRDARFGCASTLAFEFSHGESRLIVNCGGAELAGGATPVRIEQGLRGTSAHSTLVLDEANSTAILLAGRIGKGVEAVDFRRHGDAPVRAGQPIRVEASHDGYVARHGLLHRRLLALSADGSELRGEDLLEPAGRRGKRGKLPFAIRFHLGRGVDAGLSSDRRGAGLALPDGSYWQMRLGGDLDDATLSLEESLWVDGDGRPHATQQLVIEGLASRGGGRFPWLLKRMG